MSRERSKGLNVNEHLLTLPSDLVISTARGLSNLQTCYVNTTRKETGREESIPIGVSQGAGHLV